MSSDSDSQNQEIRSEAGSIPDPPTPSPERSDGGGGTDSEEPQTQVVVGLVDKGKKAVDEDHPPHKLVTWKPGKGKNMEVVETLLGGDDTWALEILEAHK